MTNKNPISNNETCKIYTDGACRGNGHNGLGSWGYVICNENNKIVKEDADYLGQTTNNRAEYNAILNALKNAIKFTRGKIKLCSDSELAIKQLNKEYRVKNEKLNKLYHKVNKLVDDFKNVEFIHVPRENKFTKIADQLCNDCLDKNCGED